MFRSDKSHHRGDEYMVIKDGIQELTQECHPVHDLPFDVEHEGL